MDKEYVVNGNKILAYFMGYEYIPYNNPHEWRAGWWKRTTHPRFRYPEMKGNIPKIGQDWYLGRNHHDLRYYNSWDWLMEVVVKLEEQGFTTSLKTKYARLNPIDGDYYHYVTQVQWNVGGYVVYSNLPENESDELLQPILGKLEPITKKQAIFIMLVEGIKILYPEILTKL